ncbi:MAG: hypothetical protein WDN47_01075 [Candidatus Doudnabacteria bacterium]
MASKAPAGPLDNFCRKLAAAEGSKSTPEKYRQALDDIFDAAGRDPQIELVVMLRKGNDVTLLGVKKGEVIANDSSEFRKILRPILTRLIDETF